MADPQNIEYRLQTTADTSGAEETTEALKDTRSEALKMQAQRDVETVQRQRAEAEAKKEAEILREIADAQQRIVAANLAKVVGEIGQQLKGLNPELDQAVTGASNFLNVFASSGNVFAALGAVATQSMRMVYDATVEANRIADEGFKNQLEAQQNLTKATIEHAKTVKAERLEAVYQTEVEKLKEQITLVEQLNELLQAGRKTDAKVQDAINPAKTPDAEVNRERDTAVGDLNASLAEAQAAAQETARLAALAISLAQEVAAQQPTNAEAINNAVKDRDAAVNAAQAAQAEAAKLEAQFPLAMQEIDAAAVQGLRSAAEQSRKAITEQATRTLAEIQAVADANEGGGPGIKAVLAKITALVQGGIDENEVQPLLEALKLAQGTSTAIRTGLSQRLADDIELARQIEEANKQRDAETKALLKEIATAVATHKGEIDELRGQIRAANGSGY